MAEQGFDPKKSVTASSPSLLRAALLFLRQFVPETSLAAKMRKIVGEKLRSGAKMRHRIFQLYVGAF